ncbi:MAG: hypothetical protein AB7N61_19170 [Acidimicrobiia bacterium]
MRLLDADNPDDRPVIRALSRHLLVENAPDSRPTARLIDAQAGVLISKLRLGTLTITMRLDVRDDDRVPRQWLHQRTPDGVDSNVPVDELRLDPSSTPSA